MRDFFKDGTGVIQNGKVFELFSTSTATNTFIKLADGKPLDKAMTEEEFLEALLPNENDVSGPLYFM
ncbi:hypothetical protein J6T66_03490 [bacterium]|nr:hypothetical protein [bacterium]